MSDAKKANNAVRTELLRALGKAFDLEGVGNNNYGKQTLSQIPFLSQPLQTFSQKFMDKLSELHSVFSYFAASTESVINGKDVVDAIGRDFEDIVRANPDAYGPQ